MSKNTSPHSRESRRNRAQPAAARVATKVRDKNSQHRRHQPETLPGMLWQMLLVVGLPSVIFVGVIIAASLTGVLLAGAPMAWLPTIIGSAWMVVSLGALSIQDASLALFPLIPAGLLVWLVARRVHHRVKERVSERDLLLLAACCVLVPTVLTLVAWFMLWDASKVYDVQAPPVLAALVRPILLHLVALALGMGPRLWKALAGRYGVPRWLVDAAITAMYFFLTLAAAAAVVLVVLVAVRWDQQGQLWAQYPVTDGGTVAGLLGLSIAYAPNAVVAVLAVLSGADFQLGEASVSVFESVLVPLPPLPLLAAVPADAPAWAPIALVLPVAVGIGVGVWRRPNWSHALAAGGWTVAFTAILVYAASGTLGHYGWVGPRWWLAAVLCGIWAALTGLAVAGVEALRRRQSPEAPVGEADPELPEEVADPELSEEVADPEVPEEEATD
ncbi:hypothetical protein G7Y31_03555 [Corynebacterium lizhenjunii]|uniref:Uncharacterized protein n=1 Tax=Corynebacterium lizhenjunii TaxID=2709394 RepID=A0A7T0PBT7_9CORY|nr:DUF6350 family protein [Corynebacterium lizhenjunii]QPK79785.1 hypothetical protein G7Y31_03555 [Corynebacterium lizhenjunii]